MGIPKKVGDKYFKFGVQLLNDKNGSQVEAFKMQFLGDSEKIVIRILQEWLQVKEDITWDILIEALRDSDLCDLANDIYMSTHVPSS